MWKDVENTEKMPTFQRKIQSELCFLVDALKDGTYILINRSKLCRLYGILWSRKLGVCLLELLIELRCAKSELLLWTIG